MCSSQAYGSFPQRTRGCAPHLPLTFTLFPTNTPNPWLCGSGHSYVPSVGARPLAGAAVLRLRNPSLLPGDELGAGNCLRFVPFPQIPPTCDWGNGDEQTWCVVVHSPKYPQLGIVGTGMYAGERSTFPKNTPFLALASALHRSDAGWR